MLLAPTFDVGTQLTARTFTDNNNGEDDQKATSIDCFSNGKCVMGGYFTGKVLIDAAGNFTAPLPLGRCLLVFLDVNGIHAVLRKEQRYVHVFMSAPHLDFTCMQSMSGTVETAVTIPDAQTGLKVRVSESGGQTSVFATVGVADNNTYGAGGNLAPYGMGGTETAVVKMSSSGTH